MTGTLDDGLMHVLMVDDGATNLKVYQKIFERIPDVSCKPYQSPEEALKWCERNEVDLVLVDFNMPDVDGHQFIERFRKMRGKEMVPVIMITANQDKDVRHRALELGANDFLNKPADPVEFIARARNLLVLRDAQKKLSDRSTWLAGEVRKATAELADRERETIFQLLRIAEFRDSDTANHIVRIGHLAALLGETIGLKAGDVELLRLAAPMHDIGKVAIPDNILLKPGKLTPEEWVVMKSHAKAGYEILKDSKSKMLRAGAEIALTHHEKYNGSGYPNALKGDGIPLSGRITALVDVFDALTSVRPYKPAWPTSKAQERIQEDAGTHFDPKLVEALFTVMPEVNAIKVRFADHAVAAV
jgi:putative two-component system response regulator